MKKRFLIIFFVFTWSIGSIAQHDHHHHEDHTTTAAQQESVSGFFGKLFNADFMPHGHCYFWRPEIVWLHVVSDGLIALAYFAIPIMLVYFIRRKKDVPFNWMFLLFGAFILLCGATHVIRIWTLWHPVYRLDGVVKAVTAWASVMTAILLFPLIPKALLLRSPRELEKLNDQLVRENQIRRNAEYKLEENNKNLEKTVAERTFQLQLKSNQLVKSNAELEQFAYIASHDLQEPLRMISSYCQLIKTSVPQLNDKQESELTENQKDLDQYINFAVEGSLRMKSLIDDLLEFSRIGRVEDDQIEEVRLEDVILLAKSNVAHQFEELGADIKYDGLPLIKIRKSEFVRVFQNLFSNALKYRRPNQIPNVHISAEKISDNFWRIGVRDEGIGISPEHFDRIFMIFQRLHARTQYPGTGMGLAICKKTVESFGGKIWVESEIGKGSTFYFTIPPTFYTEQ